MTIFFDFWILSSPKSPSLGTAYLLGQLRCFILTSWPVTCLNSDLFPLPLKHHVLSINTWKSVNLSPLYLLSLASQVWLQIPEFPTSSMHVIIIDCLGKFSEIPGHGHIFFIRNPILFEEDSDTAVAEPWATHSCSCLPSVGSRWGTSRSGDHTTAMPFKDASNTPLEPKLEDHPHQPQCEVSKEGMCWPDGR